VYAYYLTAVFTLPAFTFVFHKRFNAVYFDIFQVFKHAHTILGSIALVQIFQPSAWEAAADITKIGFTALPLVTV
jgi:hypothetical protein